MLHPHPGHLEVLVEVLAPMLAVQVHFSLCTAMRGSSDTHTVSLPPAPSHPQGPQRRVVTSKMYTMNSRV